MARILIVSHDVVGREMAGPGIRYWELSRVLARAHQVVLACPNREGLPPEESQGLRVVSYRLSEPQSLEEWARWCDVAITCGDILEAFPGLKGLGKPLVIDLYDPFILENLDLYRDLSPPEQAARLEGGLAVLRGLTEAGDFFLCANQRQRDFWLGMLAAHGRVNPHTYRADPTLERLIGVLPFGLPAQPPVRNRPVLKEVWPGIGKGDKVVLWGGGLWDWLDPQAAVRAMAGLISHRDDVKLFFLGTSHPNKQAVPEMRAAREARQLGQEMGLLDRHVFFNQWVPYDQRQDYLLEADLGLSLHRDLVEARYSSRTRLLDYIWAGLPMVVTRGDPLAEMVEARGLGLTVDCGDVEGLVKALLHLLEIPRLKESLQGSFQEIARLFHWERVAEPLLRFCSAPYPSPDRMARQAQHHPGDRHKVTLLEEALRAKEQEAAGLRELVEAYRRGRFMRTMARIQGIKGRLFGGP